MFPKIKRIVNEAIKSEIRELPCLICGNPEVDACHIKSRGSGGDDSEENLISFCRIHHIEQHKIGWYRMARKYTQVADYLYAKDWTFTPLGKIVKNY